MSQVTIHIGTVIVFTLFGQICEELEGEKKDHEKTLLNIFMNQDRKLRAQVYWSTNVQLNFSVVPLNFSTLPFLSNFLNNNWRASPIYITPILYYNVL